MKRLQNLVLAAAGIGVVAFGMTSVAPKPADAAVAALVQVSNVPLPVGT